MPAASPPAAGATRVGDVPPPPRFPLAFSRTRVVAVGVCLLVLGVVMGSMFVETGWNPSSPASSFSMLVASPRSGDTASPPQQQDRVLSRLSEAVAVLSQQLQQLTDARNAGSDTAAPAQAGDAPPEPQPSPAADAAVLQPAPVVRPPGLVSTTVDAGRIAEPVTPAPGQPRVAVLFFGLTRSLRMVYDDMRTHLLDRIPPHDVFLHTYHLKSPLVNPRAGEVNVTLNATEFRLAHPLAYEVEDQDIVDRTLPFNEMAALGNAFASKQEVRNDPAGNITLLNVLRQLHSLQRVHTLMEAHMERAGVTYDWVVLSRPDIRFTTDFEWEQVYELTDRQFLVPEFASNTGLNDRFMVGKLDAARAYCHRRDLARCLKTPLHSERFLKEAMKRDKFTPVYSKVVFTRVRANGLEKTHRV